MAADLLEIGKLRHFHAVTPDFPAQSPRAQRGAFPVILDKADVMQRHIDPDRLKRSEVELLQVGRAGFDQCLKLVVMLQTVGVFPIAPVGRAARGLHIGGGPRVGAKRAQGRGRVERTRTDFHVVGLQDRTALTCPIGL